MQIEREVKRVRRFVGNVVRRNRHRLLHGKRDGVRVLANSFPKSGTYMLSRCLELLPALEAYHDGVYVSNVGKQKPTARQHELAAVPGGCYVSAHLPFVDEQVQVIDALGFRPILILRDPRDIAVSYYRFETTYRWLPHYEFFNSLPDDASRLSAMICGDVSEGLAPLATRMQRFAGWFGHDCYITYFEKLVGENGGGSNTEQQAEVRNIAAFCELDVSDAAVVQIAGRIFNRNTQTFRKGQIGDWRNHFSAEHSAQFKAHGGAELLIQLGYETNDGW